MRTDPFALKLKSKMNPARILGTLKIRMEDRRARRGFETYVIPEKLRDLTPDSADTGWEDTAVTPSQMAHLLAGVRDTEKLTGTTMVEIGSYRGVTTQRLASQTSRKLIAIDPFIGYGGSDDDRAKFLNRTAALPNVTHQRKTSGSAFVGWDQGPVSFVFIDAVHDYANTAYDLEVWSSLTVSGGIVAMHDTDNPAFAGTRRAVFEALPQFELYAHLENLVMLTKK